MSELINNSYERKKTLKELILKLHAGESEDEVRRQLLQSLSSIPYGEVVEVEQELISEGLPEEEVLDLCDAHSAVLEGRVDLSGQMEIPEGHPVDVMLQENKELGKVVGQIFQVLADVEQYEQLNINEVVLKIRGLYNSLYDVDKLYQRKEYLLFPYLEKEGITGPPKVMWGKHDEIRELIKGSIELLQVPDISREDLLVSADIILKPAARQVIEMGQKESEILFPMAMDKLTEADWYEIKKQSLEIGYCMYDPPTEWRPDWAKESILA